jgi:hypothetical protein
MKAKLESSELNNYWQNVHAKKWFTQRIYSNNPYYIFWNIKLILKKWN